MRGLVLDPQHTSHDLKMEAFVGAVLEHLELKIDTIEIKSVTIVYALAVSLLASDQELDTDTWCLRSQEKFLERATRAAGPTVVSRTHRSTFFWALATLSSNETRRK